MSVLLDTNIVLYFLADRLAEALPSGPLAVPVVTELELLSFPGLDPDSENSIRAFLSQVSVFDLAGPVKEAALAARRNHSLRLPDAIVVGTASAHGFVLYTNDEKLVKRQVVPTKSLRLR